MIVYNCLSIFYVIINNQIEALYGTTTYFLCFYFYNFLVLIILKCPLTLNQKKESELFHHMK